MAASQEKVDVNIPWRRARRHDTEQTLTRSTESELRNGSPDEADEFDFIGELLAEDAHGAAPAGGPPAGCSGLAHVRDAHTHTHAQRAQVAQRVVVACHASARQIASGRRAQTAASRPSAHRVASPGQVVHEVLTTLPLVPWRVHVRRCAETRW